ncbi:Glycine cleavage system transcriptional activator [Achromobacter aegrifaciens]|uniref:transcriptional regulator GcvA n=1 Tax=Achromobacter aegrifaciens TaxID=1287736 RepID=UPI001467E553|nr:transcriptional regulator GcvA [Achromobacter aegrifaciens]CAB3818615.1 Glycine cleavage system transcriptional activator [Achromobacter aegrifaciens]
MGRRIPPLNPLRTFEAVARHENLTKASKELHVTQSAVSRQIALIEDYLGVPLFNRSRHGVHLTREGKIYADKVVQAFATIATATEELVRKREGQTVRVRTYMTFAVRWLIPRLPAFQALRPDIELSLSIAVPEVNFDRDDVDVAIQFGNGKWPNMQTDLLFLDNVEPVCSPKFLQQHLAAGESPSKLLTQRLLVSHYRRTDWNEWLESTGLTAAAEGAERMTFSSSVLTYQAAVDGLGIAVGQTAMLSQELLTKQLVRPFAQPFSRGLGYYLLRPNHAEDGHHVAAFRNWLMETAARE